MGDGQPTGARLRLGLGLTLAILVLEAGVGRFANSLALLSDAGHILTDVMSLALAWFAIEQSRRPADARRTYGYRRVEILVALLNGVILFLIVIFIAVEAARRLFHPVPVQAGPVIVAALLAIGINTFIVLALRGAGESLNIRAATLHVLGDIAASIGVVVAAVIILRTGWYYADPLISIGIAALIAWGAVRLVRDTWNVLLEGAPPGLDLGRVRSTILEAEGIESVHDLHVWSLDSQQIAFSCHVVVPEGTAAADGEHLVRLLEQQLCERFDIGHTTLQVESCHPCAPGDEHSPGQHNHPHPA